jgi:hypothetical protein
MLIGYLHHRCQAQHHGHFMPGCRIQYRRQPQAGEIARLQAGRQSRPGIQRIKALSRRIAQPGQHGLLILPATALLQLADGVGVNDVDETINAVKVLLQAADRPMGILVGQAERAACRQTSHWMQ